MATAQHNNPKINMNLSFYDFHMRICDGLDGSDDEWQEMVGYRPEDKDGGFRRWLELTGEELKDHTNNFQSIVYYKNKPDISFHKRLKTQMLLEF